MFFYWTIVYDMPDEEIVVAKPNALKVKSNGHVASIDANDNDDSTSKKTL